MNNINLVLISGSSCSGKTYLSKSLCNLLGDTLILSTDNYYRAGSIPILLGLFLKGYYDRIISIKKEKLKKDINEILEGRKIISCCIYDYKKKKSTKRIYSLENYKYLIVEGIFAFDICSNITDRAKIRIHIKEDLNVCIKRRYERDVEERGAKPKEIKNRFNRGMELYRSRTLDIEQNKQFLKVYSLNIGKINKLAKEIKKVSH